MAKAIGMPSTIRPNITARPAAAAHIGSKMRLLAAGGN